MPRLTSVHWKVLECIFEKDGFVFRRQEGDHRDYEKKGFIRPVITPAYKSIYPDIIRSNMRTAKMSRDEYFKLLGKCRSRA